MKKQVILYILARAVQAIVTALACNITALLFMDAAYQERGYLAVGGEMLPVAMVTVAVWYGLGWLMKVWYRDMIGGGRNDRP
jgi:hypothetical protein